MSVSIHPTAIVHDGAELGTNVEIGPFSIIEEFVKVGDGCKISSHVNLLGHTTIGKNNKLHPYVSIGASPQDTSYKNEPTRVEVGDDNIFREYVSVHRGTLKQDEVTLIGSRNLLMSYVHLGHDVIIGSDCVIVNSVNFAGHVTVGDRAIISGGTNVSQFITIGRGAYIGGATAIDRDIPPFCTAYGNRVRLKGINIVGLRRQGFTKQEISELVDFYRIMEASALSPKAYVDNESNLEEFKDNTLVAELASCIRESKIGIAPFIS